MGGVGIGTSRDKQSNIHEQTPLTKVARFCKLTLLAVTFRHFVLNEEGSN